MALYSMFFGHFDADGPLDGAPDRPAPVVVDDDPTDRLTLQIPCGLRRRVEASARLDGIPADAWIARALARSVDPRLGT